MKTLENKIALVTGSSRGLGKEMAIRLAQQGADILVTYNSNKAQADETVNEIEALGQKAVAFQLNVGDASTFDTFFNEVKSALQQHWNVSNFDISNKAVSDTRKKIKNVINLDTNIQIKMDFINPESAQKFVEKGWDEERQMYYYLVYFNKEQKS